MNLSKRKELLIRLGNYMQSQDPEWQKIKKRASEENPWFIPEFINLAAENIGSSFLNPQTLDEFASTYAIAPQANNLKKVGIVMAGNIPFAGFHDLLCVFISGHHAVIKPSSKDDVMMRHIISKMHQWEPETTSILTVQTLIPNCDAYIATGSNNSARYFEYYFNKYPSIIRKNRTSVAVLTGQETNTELESLAEDVYLYFGLGCRNVTKLYLPRHFNFVALLEAFKKYDYLGNHHKYKNNYDHHLAMLILNNKYYMSNGSILLLEDQNVFSNIAEVNYEYYQEVDDVKNKLLQNEKIQCIVGRNFTAFGKAQRPEINNFADGIDTMKFLLVLN